MSTTETRFWAKVEPTGFCWEWSGGRDKDGYGQMSVGTRTAPVTRRAHRLAYEFLVGPIGDGLVIDHLCRNKGCVNPDHLDPVTHAENIRRSHAVRSHCPAGHPLSGENLAINSRGHRTCRSCGRAACRKLYAKVAA